MSHEVNLMIKKMQDRLEDYQALWTWLNDDRVLTYYGGNSTKLNLDQVMQKYKPRLTGSMEVIPNIVYLQGKAIGYIQYYSYTKDNNYGIEEIQNAYGIDLFIGDPDLWGRGIGTQVLKEQCQWLFEQMQAKMIYIDPMTTNTRAIRVYEKIGFKKLKVIPQSQSYNGVKVDTLLLMLKKEDFI